MKKFFTFLYDLLMHDFANDYPSHTKLWSNIGYGIMSWAFVYTILAGANDIDYSIWLLFGVVVVGNKTLRDHIKKPPTP